jgi:hypothetical protein
MKTKRRLIEKSCERCGKTFGARKDAIAKGYGRFCSQHCHQKFGLPDTCTVEGCNLPHKANCNFIKYLEAKQLKGAANS